MARKKDDIDKVAGDQVTFPRALGFRTSPFESRRTAHYVTGAVNKRASPSSRGSRARGDVNVVTTRYFVTNNSVDPKWTIALWSQHSLPFAND